MRELWPCRHGDAALLRWALPAALIVAESVTLTVLVDLPSSGSALPLVRVVKLLVPVLIGGGAAGLLLARRGLRSVLEDAAKALPPWRPWPALAAHLAAFAATAALSYHLMRDGAPPLAAGTMVAWLACAGGTAALALSSAAPLGRMIRLVTVNWRVPLLALALGLLAWWVAALAEGLWGGLRAGTLLSVAWLLRCVGDDVTVDPAESLIGFRGFEVLVGAPCSGVDGLGLVLLFQALWISLARARLRLPRALLLLPFGAVAALAANVLRITALILLGGEGEAELAMGGFHSKLGWILFIAIALGSVALAERTPWLRRSNAPTAGNEGVPAGAAAHVAPLVAALTAALVSSMWSGDGFDRWYGARIAVALAMLLLVRRSLPRPALGLSWVPVLLAAGVCAIWIAWAGGDGRTAAGNLARLGPWERWTWIAVRVAGSCLVIPLVEELAFRGFLLPWLVSPSFDSLPSRAWPWPAVVVSSLAFGALHQQFLVATVAGLAFAAARLHRGRLGDAVLAHALCNAGVAGAVLIGGRWELWS